MDWFWLNSGHVLSWFWSGSGLVLVGFWWSPGLVVVRFWPFSGLVLTWFWPGSDLVLAGFWPGSGRVLAGIKPIKTLIFYIFYHFASESFCLSSQVVLIHSDPSSLIGTFEPTGLWSESQLVGKQNPGCIAEFLVNRTGSEELKRVGSVFQSHPQRSSSGSGFPGEYPVRLWVPADDNAPSSDYRAAPQSGPIRSDPVAPVASGSIEVGRK